MRLIVFALAVLLAFAAPGPAAAQAFDRGAWVDDSGLVLVVIVPVKYRYALSLIGATADFPSFFSGDVEESGGELVAASGDSRWTVGRRGEDGGFFLRRRGTAPAVDRLWKLGTPADPRRVAGLLLACDASARIRRAPAESASAIAGIGAWEVVRVAAESPGTRNAALMAALAGAWFEVENLAGHRGWTRGTFLALDALRPAF